MPPPGDPEAALTIDPASAALLADWFGFAHSVLEELRADPARPGPAGSRSGPSTSTPRWTSWWRAPERPPSAPRPGTPRWPSPTSTRCRPIPARWPTTSCGTPRASRARSCPSRDSPATADQRAVALAFLRGAPRRSPGVAMSAAPPEARRRRSTRSRVYEDLPVARGRPGVRLVMVASVDGAIAVEGTSRRARRPGRPARLSHPAEPGRHRAGGGRHRARRGLRPAGLPDDLAAARRARGQAPGPRIAIVSRSLELDWGSSLFAEADPDVRPIVVTGSDAPPERRARGGAGGRGGHRRVGGGGPARALGALGRIGASSVLAEGGPSLNGALAAAGLPRRALPDHLAGARRWRRAAHPGRPTARAAAVPAAALAVRGGRVPLRPVPRRVARPYPRPSRKACSNPSRTSGSRLAGLRRPTAAIVAPHLLEVDEAVRAEGQVPLHAEPRGGRDPPSRWSSTSSTSSRQLSSPSLTWDAFRDAGRDGRGDGHVRRPRESLHRRPRRRSLQSRG